MMYCFVTAPVLHHSVLYLDLEEDAQEILAGPKQYPVDKTLIYTKYLGMLSSR